MIEHRSHWRIGMELEHIEAIKTAVEAGSMIGCVSRLALKDAFSSGRLIEIRVRSLSLRRRFYTAIHREKYRTASIESFLRPCHEDDSVKGRCNRSDERRGGKECVSTCRSR